MLNLSAKLYSKAAINSLRPAVRWSSLPSQIKAFSTIESEYQQEIKDILTQYEEKKKRRQALIGEVVSTKCKKSITVRVEYQKYFPKYDKHLSRHNKIMAHDEEERCKLGDVVRIVPCRPMSKKKRHAIIDILRRPKLSVEEDAKLSQATREQPKAAVASAETS